MIAQITNYNLVDINFVTVFKAKQLKHLCTLSKL